MADTTAPDLFKQLIWDNLVQAALNALFRAVPLLGWGPIGFVVTYFATKYADVLYEGIKLYVGLELIVIRNTELKNQYDAASVRLKIVALDYGLDSPEFAEARDANKKWLAQYVSFNIART